MAAKKTKKKLTRSKKDKILFGVIGGFAEYFDIDPTLLRIIWLTAVAFTGFIPGIFAYFAAAVLMPKTASMPKQK